MRIAHLSDLHFSRFSFGLTQFLSKRWLGNLNLLLNRSHDYHEKRPFSLPELLESLKVTHVIITGDLTTTSSRKEYAVAQGFIECLKTHGFDVFVIPGNHDHYTKQACKSKLFYRYFPAQFSNSPFNLKDHRVTSHRLQDSWTLVALDTALATPLISSNGCFSEEIERHLIALLATIPEDENIILMNHFPFFQHDEPKRRLWRGDELQKVIENHLNIQLYLHGHTHRRCVADLRKNGLPIILDSGSTSYRKGSWNLLDIQPDGCDLEVYQCQEKGNWNRIETHEFKWPTK